MKLDIIRFQYRAIPPSADHAFDAMCAATEKLHDVHVIKGGNALVHVSRNRAIVRIRPDAEWVLFVDDDMVPHSSAAARMLEHNQPVVSAVCTNRQFPVEIAAKIYDKASDRYVPFNWVKPDRLIVGQIAIGAAFLLMSRATIDSLIEHYLTARDWLEDRRREFDRLHVRREIREAERVRKEGIRRELYRARQVVRVFGYPVLDSEEELGEDIGLSRRLIQLGIPVALDSNVLVGHLGEYAYGPWDIGRDEEQRVA